MKNLIIVLFILIINFSCTFLSNNKCLKTRAAFDIGSGTTKMKVARINICEKKIVKLLYEERAPVPYKNDSLKNNGIFSSAVVKSGLSVLKKMKERAMLYRPESFYGVATSAFRTTSNAWVITERAKNELGIEISVIDQILEGRLGYYAGLVKSQIQQKDLVVWDIGGGSFQFSSKLSSDFVTYNGRFGAVPFKNMIIKSYHKKKLANYNSPNPIGIKKLKSAANELSSLVKSEVSEDFLKVLNKKNIRVLGIGGVHFYSIRNQIHPGINVYTISQLERAMTKRASLEDKDIKSKYKDTEISNLGLVYGLMKGLGIDRVYLDNVNLADAVFFLDSII